MGAARGAAYLTDSAPFQVIDLREGDGETALNGYVLTVVYAGWLYEASRRTARAGSSR